MVSSDFPAAPASVAPHGTGRHTYWYARRVYNLQQTIATDTAVVVVATLKKHLPG